MLFQAFLSVQNNIEEDTAIWCTPPVWTPDNFYPSDAFPMFHIARHDSHDDSTAAPIRLFSQSIARYPGILLL